MTGFRTLSKAGAVKNSPCFHQCGNEGRRENRMVTDSGIGNRFKAPEDITTRALFTTSFQSRGCFFLDLYIRISFSGVAGIRNHQHMLAATAVIAAVIAELAIS